MHLKQTQRGRTNWWAMAFLAVVAGLAWYFFSIAPDESSTAVAGGTGFFAGLLAGGWFVAAGAGAVAETFLWLLILGPALVMLILSERGDPRSSLWWEEDDRRGATSCEITVSLVCVVSLFLLDYGGIPIWETIANATWPIQVAGVVAYVIIGIGWGMLRWDDLSGHLHRRRGEEIGRILKVVEKCFSDVLFQSREIRNRLKLDESEPLPEIPELSETAQLEWIQKYAHRLGLVAGSLSGQESLHALIKLLEQRKKSCRDVWRAHLSCDGSNRQYEENIPDEKLVQWIANLNSGRYPPELQAFLQEYETKWVASVSVGDHLGQIYLWTVFWPWSMGFRILRKILTLKLLRDIFIFMFNRLRFIYDRIAARHEVKFEMAPREPESPTSPTDNEKVMPIRHQASGGDLI